MTELPPFRWLALDGLDSLGGGDWGGGWIRWWMIPMVLACDDIESRTEESEHDMGVPVDAGGNRHAWIAFAR
jgi:hypothetical protein